MNRRAFVAAAAAGLAGCVSGDDRSPSGATGPATNDGETATPLRRTAEGVTATFRVVDGHAPTEETAQATFEDDRVVVTGTMDPGGCDEPTLDTIEYDADAGRVETVVAGTPRFGEDATVACGNASYDYRIEVSVETGRPSSVRVTHEFDHGDDWTTVLERDRSLL